MRTFEMPAPATGRHGGSKLDKYRHRKPTAEEFIALMRLGDMSMNDFLFVTGRRGAALKPFLDGKPNAHNSTYSPTMGDTLILELAARRPELVDFMVEIANEYAIPIDELPAEYRRSPKVIRKGSPK